MHRTLALLDMAVYLASVCGLLFTRSRSWGWLLLLAAAAWLPLNNSVLEGPVIATFEGDHGLTGSDLLGIGGAFVAGLRLWPSRQHRTWPRCAAVVATVVVVLAAAFVVAAGVTDDRSKQRLHYRDRAPQVPREAAFAPAGPDATGGQRSSLDIRRSASSLPPV